VDDDAHVMHVIDATITLGCYKRAKYKKDQRAIEAISKQNPSPTIRKVPHQPNWRQHQNRMYQYTFFKRVSYAAI